MVGRILIMDDEKYVRWALREHLRGCGFSITEASDVHMALEIIEKSIFDALLLDVELIGKNGTQLIEKVRMSPQKAHIFLVSKEDPKHYHNLALDWGVRGIIKKPFRISEINAFLEEALK